jgi:DegV family protein with EDD domain
MGTLASEYGIEVVPLSIRFGNEEYRDGADLTEQEFYRKLATGAAMPITAQPSPGTFAATYRRLIDGGAERIISVHIAGTLSGTVNAAAIAAREVAPETISVVDSRTASAGLGMLAMDAARRAAGGEGTAEIIAALTADIPKVQLFATIPTLTYLARGGRIGNLSGLVGNVLRIVPILTLSDGVVKEFAKVRTFARAVDQVVEISISRMRGGAGPRVAVVHSMAPELAQTVANRIRAAVAPQFLYLCSVGPTVGTHAGPGAVGVFFIA